MSWFLVGFLYIVGMVPVILYEMEPNGAGISSKLVKIVILWPIIAAGSLGFALYHISKTGFRK